MLDPEISLQVKNPDPPTINNYLSMAKTAQDIQNAQVMNKNLQAETAGIQARSNVASREDQAQQWLQDNARHFITSDANGKKVLDQPQLAVAMSEAGFPDHANGLYAHYLDNKASELDNTDATYDLVNKAKGDTAALLANVPAGPAQNAAGKRQAQFLDQFGNVPGTGIPMGTASTSQFWAKNPDGTPILDPNGNPALDNTVLQGMKTSTIPAATQESIRQFNAINHTSPEAMDPNSQQSKAAQALAVQLGYANKDDDPQSDFYWYNNRPDFKQGLTSIAPSQSLQDRNKENALSAISSAAAYDVPIAAVSKAIQSGVMPPGVSVVTALNNFFQGRTNDPEYQAALTLLEKVKRDDPTIDPSKIDGPSLLAKLNAGQQYHLQMGKYYTQNNGVLGPKTAGETGGIPSAGTQGQPGLGVQQQEQPQPQVQQGPGLTEETLPQGNPVQQTVVPQGTPIQPKQAAPAQPKASSSDKVLMRSPDGKRTGYVPQSRVNDYLKQGYTKAL